MISINKLNDVLPKIQQKAVNAWLPPEVHIPIDQDDFCKMNVVVNVGEKIEEGQIIARDSGALCNVHSSVPGIVKEIKEIPLPNGKRGTAVSIITEGGFSFLGKPHKKQPWDFLSGDQLIRLLADKGVVNTFEKPIPMSVEIARRKKYFGNCNLILRLFDEDPTSCTDSFVAKNYLPEVLEGMSILSTIFAPSSVYVLYDKTTSMDETVVAVRSLFNTVPFKFVPTDVSKYPQGNRNSLIKVIKNAMNNSFAVPVTTRDLMVDPVSAYSISEATTIDQPVITRFVSICGDAPGMQKVFKARIGTPIFNLLQECGGLVEKPGKIIINGTLGGKAIHDFATPVCKSTKSVTITRRDILPDAQPCECVHCGRCRKICSVQLHPDTLFVKFYKNAQLTKAEINTSRLCADCRLCNMVCPSRLPLYQTIKQISQITKIEGFINEE